MNKEELIKYFEENYQTIIELDFVSEFLMFVLYGDKSNKPIINQLYKKLKTISDAEKTDIINYFDNNYIKFLVVYSYNDLNLKIAFAEQFVGYKEDKNLQELYLILIDYFPDEVKVRIINNINDFSIKVYIIRKLNHNLQTKLLFELNKDIYNQSEQEILDEIILHQDKQAIINLVPKLLTDKSKLIVIEHLKNLNATEEELYRIAVNLLTDEALFKTIELFKTEQFRYKIAMKLKQDKYKFASLDLLESDFNKQSIATSLRSDEYILQALSKFNDTYDIVQVTNSLSKDSSKMQVFDMFSNNFVRISIIMSITKDENKIQLLSKMENNHDQILYGEYLSLDESKIKYIKKLLEDEKFKKTFNLHGLLLNLILSFKNPQNLYKFQDIINYLFKNLDDYCKDLFIADLVHSTENKNACYEILFEQLLELFSNRKNIDKNKLRHVAKLFGNEIFEYLKEPKIIHLLFILSNEEFTKLHQLFNNEALSMNDVYGIFNSFIQHKFNIEYKEEREIFTQLLNSIEINDFNTIQLILDKITNTQNILKIFNDKEFQLQIKKYFSNSFTIPTTQEEFSKFLLALIKEIAKYSNNEKKEQLINILHKITDLNINLLRDKYVKENTNNIQNHVNLIKAYDKESIIKNFLKPSINSENDILSIIYTLTNVYAETLDHETKELLNNPTIIAECIKFKRDPKKYQETIVPKHILVKKYLKQFNKILNLAYEQGLLSKASEVNFLIDLIRQNPIENTYSVNSHNCYYNILLELNPEYLKNELFPNPELFNKLKKLLSEYKLANWGDTFLPILQSLDLEITDENVGILINSFDKIIANTDISELKPIELVNLINLHTNLNNHPKVLFGLANYSYLANNPGPNSAGMNKRSRIKGTLNIYRQMYERSKITIPPIDTIVSSNNGNDIRIVVGDIINPINLTLGERTGACMRVGGAGESLFNFCNINPNGFHIRFEDPSTGELISRVSGFRNGNTVFLNQLRDSLNEKYSNTDIIMACKKAAKQIINLATQNNDSIDNVVISSGYAMEMSGLSEIQLNVQDIKEGYDYFYSDVNNSAIVLETSKNKQFVPVDLTSPKKEYDVLRHQPIICLQPETANFQVNRLLMIESLLTTGDSQNNDEVNNVNSAIVGEDWIIYTTKDGETISKIINGISDERKKIATNEMIEYLSKYSQYFETSNNNHQTK